MDMTLPLVTFLVCYVIGSFPTAYYIGQHNNINIFEVGSGNMGTNNVIRALGWQWGALVFLGDAGKGILAILVARLMWQHDWIAGSVIGGVAAVIGHNWSLLATLLTGKLRGGKGAATLMGTWLMMMPWYVIGVSIMLWGLIILATRYMSLGVLVACAIGTVWMLILIGQHTPGIPALYALYVAPTAVMVYVRHWENIRRLLTGRERRMGERA
jgi:acyl phosphate:glycerol-3-phosphate acyltransferase